MRRIDPLALLSGDVLLAARDLDDALRRDGTLEAIPAEHAAWMASLLRRGAHRAISAAILLDSHARSTA